MTSITTRRRWTVVGFLSPFLLLMTLFLIVPILFALYQSVMGIKRSGAFGKAGSPEFVGLNNYIQALGDPTFTASFGRVLLFAAVQVPLMIVFATVLALLLDAASARWVKFFRTAFFLPYGVPGVIASMLWGFLYTPQLSPLIDVGNLLGIRLDFLGGGSILWSIANIVTWQYAGYNMLVLVAQLKSIDQDLFEAAEIDGANAWQMVTKIKLPLIRPALILTTVFTIIGTIQLFTEPMILQPISPSIGTGYTPNLAAYNEAFTRNNYNLAAAEAVILAVAATGLSFGFLKFVTRKERSV
ncbi:carbohydrate ABC transporter permease [Arthrobacter sp. NPDC058097]|uniref:carbohydrate ABC transporter permease n=1 Tax=Arthrobacter sp. NPDC058097 TaxID=3346340 RepID=UPI0036DE65A6